MLQHHTSAWYTSDPEVPPKFIFNEHYSTYNSRDCISNDSRVPSLPPLPKEQSTLCAVQYKRHFGPLLGFPSNVEPTAGFSPCLLQLSHGLEMWRIFSPAIFNGFPESLMCAGTLGPTARLRLQSQ